jgi:hypothetical protein
MDIQAILISSILMAGRMDPLSTMTIHKKSWLTQSLPSQTPPLTAPNSDNPPLFFRTTSYRVEIIWRRERPYMTVSQNGWRVIVDVPAKVTPPRGDNDAWTSYICASGDYAAIVRVGSTGEGVIEVRRSGQRITQEYALPSPQKTSIQPEQNLTDGTALVFVTERYAVHVYRQKGGLYMNLYNQQSKVTELKRVPVKQVNMSEGRVYRYEGDATVQAREDFKGRRTLLILRDNEIQYRGEGN